MENASTGRDLGRKEDSQDLSNNSDRKAFEPMEKGLKLKGALRLGTRRQASRGHVRDSLLDASRSTGSQAPSLWGCQQLQGLSPHHHGDSLPWETTMFVFFSIFWTEAI